MMFSFLADENISPETAEYLESQGHRCLSILRDGPRGISDREIVALAHRNKYIIITHDLDFGQIYYSIAEQQIGVIVLRLNEQTVEAVNDVLGRFLSGSLVKGEILSHSLVVLSERRYRIYRGARGDF
ncbi:MAG: hypothetical protein GY764_07585 [Halieaceae bacterium]|nr:hypothetical protein [Halieaceae bacterium]